MRATIFSVLLACIALPASAASEADLANNLSNPISSTNNAPFQFDYGCCNGANSGGARLANVNNALAQSFITNNGQDTAGLTSASESGDDLADKRWSMPLNLTLNQILSLGVQPMSFRLGGKYYAERPEATSSWGLRFAAVLLFPQ